MSPRPRRTAPIVVAADDDWEALGRMVELVYDVDVISVKSWPRLKDAVNHFEPDLVLLADTLRYPRMTAERMVAKLYTEFRSKILVLAEFVTPAAAARWRERGAVDCLLHPTKFRSRMGVLAKKVFELTCLGKGPARPPEPKER